MPEPLQHAEVSRVEEPVAPGGPPKVASSIRRTRDVVLGTVVALYGLALVLNPLTVNRESTSSPGSWIGLALGLLFMKLGVDAVRAWGRNERAEHVRAMAMVTGLVALIVITLVVAS